MQPRKIIERPEYSEQLAELCRRITPAGGDPMETMKAVELRVVHDTHEAACDPLNFYVVGTNGIRLIPVAAFGQVPELSLYFREVSIDAIEMLWADMVPDPNLVLGGLA